jgi:hypothetical protein
LINLWREELFGEAVAFPMQAVLKKRSKRSSALGEVAAEPEDGVQEQQMVVYENTDTQAGNNAKRIETS